ncbi:MAG: hypothetical protein ACE5LD_03055 [Candidatus Bipolaricaulia bacterium]
MTLDGQLQVLLANPPRSIDTLTREAPASRLFSTNSLTTEAGRSITSPAAILFTR